MSDYISRESALKAIFDSANSTLEFEDPADSSTMIYLIATSNAREAVKGIPAADVVPRDWHDRCMEIEIQNRIAADVRPVMHGEWINKKTVFVTYGSAECSACGERTSGSKVDTGWGVEFEYPNFCPNCGADMREAENDI